MLLQTTRMPAAVQPAELLGREIAILDEQGDPAAWLATYRTKVRCLITHSMRGAPSSLLEALPELRLIANFGAGLELIDMAVVRKRGILVTATGDLLTDDVADLALCMMLMLLRGNAGADAFARSGRWASGAFPLGRSAAGRRVGILGFGKIGRAIAERGAALKMAIGYHSRKPVAGAAERYHDDPVALAAWAEVLVVALPGGDATRHLIDARLLAALGRGGMLVNIARGSVVDEDALCDALRRGQLAGAALDVFEDEPNPAMRILTAPRLLMSPHIGSATSDTRRAMVDHVVDNIRAWEAREPLTGLVN